MKTSFFILLFTTASLLVNAQSWAQIGNDIDGENAHDYSGHSICLSADGSKLAIGAPLNDHINYSEGHVRVYENIAGVWTQIGNDINGESLGDRSGTSVSLSSDGNVVAIGAPYNSGSSSGSGHVRVYENIAGNWVQIGNDIDGEDISDESGTSVCLNADGSVVAIGAIDNHGGGSYSGHVRVFENIAGSWTQRGNDIDGEASEDRSGCSVSLSADGTVVAIGARNNDGSGYGVDAGHVRVYEYDVGTWTQIGNDINGEYPEDHLGCSVSLSADGSVVAIGAYGNDWNGNNAGHVRIYQNNAGNWSKIGNDIDGVAPNDNSGYAINLSDDGSVLAVGAPAYSYSDFGQVRVFKNNSGTWNQIGSDIYGEAPDDQFGFSVSLSADGSVLAIGSHQNDGNGTNSGHVRVFNLTTDIEENLVVQSMNIYPNPATNTISVDLQPIGEARYSILDTHGCEVLSHTYTDKTINVSSLPPGIYFLHIEDDGKIYKGEFIKE